MEGYRGVEYGNSILFSNHPSGGKTPAIADRIYLVHNLFGRITGPQEIGVHGVGEAGFIHCSYRSVQGLCQYLTAEDARRWWEAYGGPVRKTPPPEAEGMLAEELQLTSVDGRDRA